LIEYRILPHIEVLLRNTILNLGYDWSYTIICGKENYSFMEKMANDIHKNIKVINTKHDFMNQNIYNNFLLTTSFWNLFTGEKILIYQGDSFIFKSNIEEFLHWDYIGSPFSFDCVKPINVGNGALSLRSKSKMLEVLNRFPIDKIDKAIFLPNTIEYKLEQEFDYIPEDIYFSQILQTYKIGTVADYNTANQFSSETVYTEDCFSTYCMWRGCKIWKHKLNKYFEIKYKNNIKRSVVILSHNAGGGLSKYVNDLLNFKEYLNDNFNNFEYVSNQVNLIDKKYIYYNNNEIINYLHNNFTFKWKFF